MIKKDEKGKLEVSLLEIQRPLPVNIIEEYNHKNAIKEKDYCITQCTYSWDSQAALEHSGAEADRMNLEKNQIRLDNLNKRLGLLMERQLQ